MMRNGPSTRENGYGWLCLNRAPATLHGALPDGFYLVYLCLPQLFIYYAGGSTVRCRLLGGTADAAGRVCHRDVLCVPPPFV